MKGRISSLPLCLFFLGEKQATFDHFLDKLDRGRSLDLQLCKRIEDTLGQMWPGCLKVPCPEGKMNICIECKALFRQSRERHMSGTQHNLSDT